MKKSSKIIDLCIAIGMNIVFFVVFVFLFKPLHETNDDLALSFLVEGAYGERSPYLVYQNVLWGKFLVGLYTLVPTVKWYNILMLLMLFLGFSAMSYSFIRIQGKKMGIAASSTLLIFCGYYSYVVFQYSRIAPVVTAGGLVLLFYAIEYADTKFEKIFSIIVGILLAVWGSLIRFQMFGLAVVLVGGAIGLYKVFLLVKNRQAGWLKQIGIYAAVFGSVGVLSLVCYVVDQKHYASDEVWAAYQEFNAVRTELWDYGFPEYEGNEEAFEEIGVSESDFEYYQTWNMDEEAMTIENLQVIADAKPEKTFDMLGFLSIFPKYFFSISVFVVFLVLGLLAVGLKWKNLYFVLFEFAGVMVFEAYFYYIGRYGITRVDNGMWMVAVIALMYGMSEDLAKLGDIQWKKVLALVGIAGVLFIADFTRTTVAVDGRVGATKEFFEEVTQDDEHLYIMMGAAPKIYYGFDFWEACDVGELSNIYNAYGWEFNVGVKKAVLEDYGVTNIYRDSINNDAVYFVTSGEQDMLEAYIKENYDPNAVLEGVTAIEGAAVWRVTSLENAVE